MKTLWEASDLIIWNRDILALFFNVKDLKKNAIEG